MKLRHLTTPFTLSARRTLAQPADLLVAVLFYTLVTIVLVNLWQAAAGANGGRVAGYSALALTWYAATAEASIVPLRVRAIEEIGDDIATGAIAVEMLRPASMLAVRVAVVLGEALPRLLAFVAVGSVLAVWLGGPPPDATALALAAPSLALALACNATGQHAFAGAAFWIRDARSAWFLYHKLVFFLGGMLIPLEVLPGPVSAFAKATPFMAMSYAPARLAAGHVEPVLLLVQLGWLVVLIALAAAVFRAGQRRLQRVGG